LLRVPRAPAEQKDRSGIRPREIDTEPGTQKYPQFPQTLAEILAVSEIPGSQAGETSLNEVDNVFVPKRAQSFLERTVAALIREGTDCDFFHGGLLLGQRLHSNAVMTFLLRLVSS
jgi:hypothetical protein